MSEISVRQHVAAMRAQAESLEKRANDPSHEFTDASHRDHMLTEARRLREAADREEQSLSKRRNFH
jgi:hypothetical protein